MSQSTISRRSGKAPRFPLWHHKGSGRWCKKIGNHFKYFAKVLDDPDGTESLSEWLDFKNGVVTPRPSKGHLTLRNLVNKWLAQKEVLCESGEIAPNTFRDYYKSGSFLLASLGKHTPVEHLGPEDFLKLRGRMALSWGPIRLRVQMGIYESIFHFAAENELIASKVRFGTGWKKPSAKTLRKQRATTGPKLFEPEQIHAVVKKSNSNLKSMCLLGLGAGMGPTDISRLSVKVVEESLRTGFLDWPRRKTSIPRHIPLWDVTIAALRRVLAERPEPRDLADGSYVFLTPTGRVYFKNDRCRISGDFATALKAAGIEGRAFYDLRRTFQTIGEEAGDLVAVQSIMGHAAASDDMSAVYRQRVSDERLQRVVEVVRHWLYEGGES